ncbi:protein NPAT isoform 3-T3 [Discoglossus pictus]
MLLPSDVARLVLGYLQQEKLATTCRAFIAESPNLKEYAEHYTDEGFVPGCLLSLFGKNLIAILNEYISLKSKESKDKSKDEMPLMISSLWKKLDHTLSQIRTMQDSAAFHTHQRARTRSGIEDIKRQKMLLSPALSTLSRRFGQQTSTPISSSSSQVVLRPVTGVTQAVASPLFAGQSTIQGTSSLVNVSNGETLQVISVGHTEKKTGSAHSSPMRRKHSDSQRRRRGAVASCSAAAASCTAATQEGEAGKDTDALQELIDANFPQIVIENAREKILGNKSLQEKLAENINKFLGSDSSAHPSRPADSGTVEQEASIDEILGLQPGEMHMSDEAIHDILTQTELDPDFQELYDLFAMGPSKSKKPATCDPPTPAEQDAVSDPPIDKDSMESSMEEAVDSTSYARSPIDDVHPEQNEIESPYKRITRSCTQKTPDGSKKSLQASGHGKTSTVDPSLISKTEQKSRDSVCNLDITESDSVVEPSVEPHPVFELALSQSQDVEMKNSSLTSGNDSTSHLCKGVKSLSVVSSDGIIPNTKLRTCKESPQSDSNQLDIIDCSSHEPKLNTSTSSTSEQPCKTVPESVSVVVSSESPVSKTVSPPEENKQLEVITIPSDTDDSSDDTIVDLLSETSNISPAKQMKVQKKLFDTVTDVETPLKNVTETVDVNSSMNHSQSVTVGSSDTSECVTVESVASSSPAVQAADTSNLMTLQVIIEDLTSDSELSNTKSLDGIGSTKANSAAEAVISSVDQSHTVVQPKETSASTVNIQTNISGDGLLQLVPSTSTAFGPTNSIFISTCMTNTTAGKQSNIMMLPSNSAPTGIQTQPCVYQTPPRPGNVYTVGQAISPKLSQGSTIILASPVQPVLQGVVGMFPVSVVGQSGSTTFQAPSHQVLHVPVSKGGVPKLPLPPKSQKPTAPRSQTSTGKPSTNPTADSTSRPSSLCVPRVENTDKNIALDVQERLLPDTTNPSVKTAENHRRVLCFGDPATTTVTSNTQSISNSTLAKTKDNNDTVCSLVSSSPVCSSDRPFLPKEDKKSGKTSPTTVTNSRSDLIATTVASSKEIAGEKRSVPAESSADVCSGAVSNKENLQIETEKQGISDMHKKPTSEEGACGHSGKTVQPAQETVRKQTPLPNILRRTPQDPRKLASEKACLSPLTKQASDILQGIQFLSPNTKHSTGDLPVPRTPGSGLEDLVSDEHCDSMRTPVRKRFGEDGGTPKPMLPPATPEIPACSPASEAGSENSVSMAAHTLMILSRASVSKTSGTTPLKDNAQQVKSSRKRKLEELDDGDRQSHKIDSQNPTAFLKKKKMKKHRKKSVDCFPAGMDVDKFLMSLQYDE